MKADVWQLVTTSLIAQSIECTIKGQSTALRANIDKNDVCVVRQ